VCRVPSQVFVGLFCLLNDSSGGLLLAFDRPMVSDDTIVKTKLRLANDGDWLL
jgi:hypothetical protein